MSYLDKALQYGLMAIAFCLPFVNLNHFSEYLFIGLLIAWIGKKVLADPFVFKKTALDIPILALLGWILLTIPFATDWSYSFEEWRKAIPRFLMFWFVVHVVQTESQVRGILFSFSVGLLLLASMESYYFLAQGGEPLSMKQRAGSLTGSSQWLSYYLVIGLPVVLLGWFCEARILVRLTYLATLSMILIALFLVHTRAAWVAVIAQGLFLVVLRVTRNWGIAGSAVIAGVLLLLIVLALPGKHREVVSASEFTHPHSMLLRFNTWGMAIDDIRKHPLTGIGYGKHSFQQRHQNLGEKYHTHIHNSFLASAVEIGLPGFVIFSWIFWTVLKTSSNWVKKFADQYFGKLSLAVFLITLGLIVRSLFDDMILGTVLYLFMLFSGVCFSQALSFDQELKKDKLKQNT